MKILESAQEITVEKCDGRIKELHKEAETIVRRSGTNKREKLYGEVVFPPPVL